MNTERGTNSEHNREARICLFSQRHLQRLVSRCVDYEFEDVICEVDDVELLACEPYRYFNFSQKVVNKIAKYVSIAELNPGLRRLRLKNDYDLFVVVCMFPRDLLAINAIKGWKESCRTSICWLDEIWSANLNALKGHMKILSQFDYIVLNCSQSVGPVQDIIQKPCFYIPPGVDAIRFCPYPNPPVRSIDVFNLGRRSPVTHEALLKMVEARRIFYMYDTINRMDTYYPRQHRDLIANLAKRSRYFLANAAKVDRDLETQGQSEIGFRFFEGAASGTVMIGQPPTNEAFREHFNWPDSVIRIPRDASNITEILDDLDSQKEHLKEIRKNNVVQSLLRHDWAYRWRVILDMVNLEAKEALTAREKRLELLADMANGSS